MRVSKDFRRSCLALRETTGRMASLNPSTTGSSTLPLMNRCWEYMRKSSTESQVCSSSPSLNPMLQAHLYPKAPNHFIEVFTVEMES